MLRPYLSSYVKLVPVSLPVDKFSKKKKNRKKEISTYGYSFIIHHNYAVKTDVSGFCNNLSSILFD